MCWCYCKHAALHNDGHDEVLLPPSTDGNPYSHLYWLATKELTRKRSTPKIHVQEPKLVPLQNLKDKLQDHMHQQHCLGDASRESEYYNAWTKLLSLANAKTSNSFWACSIISFQQKCNVLTYRIGT